ncbi:glycine oxidase ThiO [Shouchella lonarensis]|uniref:glycine oxidase n=1 Tax=Shouchella lonarensis TaxID=1464122 RepID=A0A1G6IUY6_9BACI|nr:glycine oxidase [Shouchella lonarensis]
MNVIVLGGGVIGLASALALAEAGMKVTLLEKAQCGGQASGAAAGMLAPYSEIGEDPDDFFHLCQASLRLFPQWQAYVKECTGRDFAYTRSGSLYLVYHEADLLALSTRQAWQSMFGVKSTVLTQAEVCERVPSIAPDVVGALYYPEEAHIYAPDYVLALEGACRKKGVIIREELGFIALHDVRESGVSVKIGAREVLHADRIVVATGAWTECFAEKLNLSLPIYPIRGQICAYHANPLPTEHMLYTSQGYLVPKMNGTMVSGASEDIAGFNTEITEKGITRLKRWNKKILPYLAAEEPFHTWAGLRPATQDGYPFIGPLENYPSIYMACGHYRNGILLSAITAKVITEQMQQKKPTIKLDAFCLERFSYV